MSHVVDCAVVIKDLDVLEETCKEMGLELVRGQTKYKWYGRWMNDYNAEQAAFNAGIKPEDYGKCEHAIRIPGDDTAYEIGLVPNPDKEVGGWRIIFDFYGTQGAKLVKKIGKFGGELAAQYGERLVTKKAKKLGYKIKDRKEDKKKIKLTLVQK